MRARWLLLLVPLALAAKVEGPADPRRGATLYAEHCALCHGAGGEGGAADHAPALNHPAWLALASDAYLTASILWGRPGTTMSAWGEEKGGPLDAEELRDLVAWLRTWQTLPSVTPRRPALRGSPGRGMGLYAMHCAECHGTDGKSDTLPDITNPAFLRFAGADFVAHTITHGRPGTAMKGFGETLGDQGVADVVYWLYSRAEPLDLEPSGGFAVDWTRAVLNPEGQDPRFKLRDGRYVAIDEVRRAMEKGQRMVLADARATSDYLAGHIEGAVSVPFYAAGEAATQLPKDAWVLAYCGCPHAASGKLIDQLAAAGFSRVAVLDEGYYPWVERGYPVRVGATP